MRKRKISDLYGMHDEEYVPGGDLPDPWNAVSRFEYEEVTPIAEATGEVFLGFSVENVEDDSGRSSSSFDVITLLAGDVTFTVAFDTGGCSKTRLSKLRGMEGNVGRTVSAAWVGHGAETDGGWRGTVRHVSIDVVFDDGDRARLSMVSQWDHCGESAPFVTDMVSGGPVITSDFTWAP